MRWFVRRRGGGRVADARAWLRLCCGQGVPEFVRGEDLAVGTEGEEGFGGAEGSDRRSTWT
jgi:hypothetical protein